MSQEPSPADAGDWLTSTAMVGLSGLEPLTSRLSGVRSNQLSYRPMLFNKEINGGDEENRTPDPLLARQVLSQLSYAPIYSSFHCHALLLLSVLGQRMSLYASVGPFVAPSLTAKLLRILPVFFPHYFVALLRLRSTYVSIRLGQAHHRASYCEKNPA